MNPEAKASHTYEAKIDTHLQILQNEVSIIVSEICPVRNGDSQEFCFWMNELIGVPRFMFGAPLPQVYQPATWNVHGCISKVAFDATQRTYENRLSTWNDALPTAVSNLSSICDEYCKVLLARNIGLPIISLDHTKHLRAIFFKLLYTREEVLAGSVPFALDEKINVGNISRSFSGFFLTLRTSKNKAAKKLIKKEAAVVKKIEAAMAQETDAGPCTSGIVNLAAGPSTLGISDLTLSPSASRSPKPSGSPSASGNPKTAAGASASGSPMKRAASPFGIGSPIKRAAIALGSRKGYTELADSSSESSLSESEYSDPIKLASSTTSESPFKRIFGSVLASRSPTERAASPSSASSSDKPRPKVVTFWVYGLVNLFQDKQNPIVLPLYSLHEDLVNYLIGRFGCGKMKELRYVKKSKAREYCKTLKIKDPFQ